MKKKEIRSPSKVDYILVELGHHLPYTIFGVSMGLMLVSILSFFVTVMQAEKYLPHAAFELFHTSHASHILFSAVTTTAMFWKHEKRILKAVIIGTAGSIGICALSDSVFPSIGGKLFGLHMPLHICIIEHPNIVLPFAIFGVIAGFLIPGSIEKSTQYSHSIHVLFSSISAILYLLSFGLEDWIHSLGGIFIIAVVSVMIPCCLSGIVFPLFCVHRGCAHGDALKCEHESEVKV